MVILVVVHPGSACGSADFSLGHLAAPARDALAREIAAWEGDVLVVDGALGEEIATYPTLDIAIEVALDPARDDRRSARRVRACALEDGDWLDRAVAAFATGWPDGAAEVVVTGAWTQGDGGGCVDAVREALAERVADARVSAAALRIDAA